MIERRRFLQLFSNRFHDLTPSLTNRKLVKMIG